MLKEEKIREAARAAGIEMIGFAEPHPLTEWLEILEKRREQGRITSFERTPPSRRVDYSQAFPKVKGIIVIGVPYCTELPEPEDNTAHGSMASVAWGQDYHEVVTEKMNGLMALLKETAPSGPGHSLAGRPGFFRQKQYPHQSRIWQFLFYWADTGKQFHRL